MLVGGNHGFLLDWSNNILHQHQIYLMTLVPNPDPKNYISQFLARERIEEQGNGAAFIACVARE